jgi:hypothetical protein
MIGFVEHDLLSGADSEELLCGAGHTHVAVEQKIKTRMKICDSTQIVKMCFAK